MKTMMIVTALLTLGVSSARSQTPAFAGDSAAQIAAVTVGQTVQGDTTRPPLDFVDVDKEPDCIVKKEPAYPALALKAGIEGRVWVKMWIDKSGMVHDAVVIKSDQDIFNAPALEAARQFRFTPATIKGKPVDVWVSVPFKFKLAEKTGTNRAATDTVHGVFPKEIIKFARKVLEGGSPDTGSVARFVAERAQAVAGGYLKPLAQAMEEQRHGKQSIEQPGRMVVFCIGGMADDGHSGYIVARTESARKDARPHYHTIIIQLDAGGQWKIVHWHTWHSSR